MAQVGWDQVGVVRVGRVEAAEADQRPDLAQPFDLHDVGKDRSVRGGDAGVVAGGEVVGRRR